MEKLIALPAVCEATGLSKVTIYRKEKLGIFPARIKVTSKASRWVESEVAEWISDTIEQSRVSGDAA